MSRIFVIFAVCLSLSVFVSPAFVSAQNEGESAPSEEQIKRSELVEAQEDALKEKVGNTVRKLDQREMTHFIAMFTNYNVYSIVSAIRDDVKGAVDRCADSNRDMADRVQQRFSKWDETVGGTMIEANNNIQNMALAQSYISQAELKIIFGLVDEVRAINSSRFESVPVSTPEACEFMLSKMDETEQSMQQMLTVSLQSYPNLLKKNQE